MLSTAETITERKSAELVKTESALVFASNLLAIRPSRFTPRIRWASLPRQTPATSPPGRC